MLWARVMCSLWGFVFAHGFLCCGPRSIWVVTITGMHFSAGLWGVFALNSVEPLRIKLSGSICSGQENASGSPWKFSTRLGIFHIHIPHPPPHPQSCLAYLLNQKKTNAISYQGHSRNRMIDITWRLLGWMRKVEGCGSKADPGRLIICILSSSPDSPCSEANR